MRGRILWEGLQRLREQETFEPRLFLALPAEPERAPPLRILLRRTRARRAELVHRLLVLGFAERRAEARRDGGERGRGRRGALNGGGEPVAGVFAPREDRALGFRVFAEDEPEEDVEASERKEEEGGDKREVVDVVREHGCANPVSSRSVHKLRNIRAKRTGVRTSTG